MQKVCNWPRVFYRNDKLLNIRFRNINQHETNAAKTLPATRLRQRIVLVFPAWSRLGDVMVIW